MKEMVDKDLLRKHNTKIHNDNNAHDIQGSGRRFIHIISHSPRHNPERKHR